MTEANLRNISRFRHCVLLVSRSAFGVAAFGDLISIDAEVLAAVGDVRDFCVADASAFGVAGSYVASNVCCASICTAYTRFGAWLPTTDPSHRG